VKRGTYRLLPVLALGLIGGAYAGSPFERGVRTTLGPSLPHDSPPASTSPAATAPAAAALAAIPIPSAAAQATAATRSVMQKVDPTVKSLQNRQETDPNKAKNPGNTVASSQTQLGVLNKQEINVGADSAKADVAAKDANQLQHGLLNEQKSNVGVTE
jgi:hypothetical protein